GAPDPGYAGRHQPVGGGRQSPQGRRPQHHRNRRAHNPNLRFGCTVTVQNSLENVAAVEAGPSKRGTTRQAVSPAVSSASSVFVLPTAMVPSARWKSSVPQVFFGIVIRRSGGEPPIR